MKYIVVVGDGMADRPLDELGGKTPLEAAKKPSMDYIARHGRCGLLKTLREGMPLGSDIANLSIMGYDPSKYYPGGRGPLEAASLGIQLRKKDMAFRCNLINQRDGVITDHSGGHITTEESRVLMKYVDEKLGSEAIEFYSGIGYRNIMVLKDAEAVPDDLEETPPHDVLGSRIEDNLIKAVNPSAGVTASMLNNMMLDSIPLLESHPLNLKRHKKGKKKANMIWFWGGGRKTSMPSFTEKYALKGALISAVDLLKGIASLIGLDNIDVPGATGYFDTDYAAKAKYAIKALEEYDLVYLHIEAPDEAGHEGDIEEKIKAIEAIDREILAKLLKAMEDEEFTIAILPDHATPIEARTHTQEAVPFAIYSAGEERDEAQAYSEKEAAKGSFGLRKGHEFMDLLLQQAI